MRLKMNVVYKKTHYMGSKINDCFNETLYELSISTFSYDKTRNKGSKSTVCLQ